MLNASGAGVLEVRPLAKRLPIIVKKTAPSFSVKYSPLFFLLCSLQTGVSQYVDVRAEVHINGSRRFEEYAQTIHVVVGTNSWQMDGDFCSNCEATYWFTDNRIIEHTKITKMPETDGVELSEAELNRIIGAESTKVYDCPDGNPNLPTDTRAWGLELLGQIGWIAFCSGPYLQREGHEVFPPSSLWKQLIPARAFLDRTVRFNDSFGLPKRMELYATNSPNIQPVVQYRVFNSTNILGWEFPLEFRISQYCPAPLPGSPGIVTGTNGWEIEFTARGKVTSIREGAKPQIPENVLRAAEK
jgi:hypothetical protein